VDQTLTLWLSRFGTPVLFFAQLFGIFGVPIPDEFLLTVAGALVRRGQLNGPMTMAAAIGGCMGGITLSYVLGRTVGATALRRLLRVHEETFDRTQRWFTRFGHWLLTFGYFIPGVRHVTAIAAGSVPLTYRAFARAAYPGAVLWCSVFVGLGYYTGERWERYGTMMRSHLSTIAAIAGAAAVLFLIVRFATRSRT
jgi:membrane protein DedA with SNARE-associated domain